MKSSVEIFISKNPSMADERVDITISGLQRAQKITLHGLTRLERGESFESYSHYIANDEGRVSLDQEKSLGGTYEGIEPMGPFWSLKPSLLNKKKHERFNVRDPSKPFVLRLCVYDSFLSLEEVRNSGASSLSSLDVMRTYTISGVTCEEIRVGRVRGFLFLPPGKGTFPGIISMSGGFPGAMKFKGALLASHGYATLALKYFGADDLPKTYTDLDLTYFEEAAVYLKHHERVSAEGGVGIVANCLGASIALGLAAVAPPGLIKCVVPISGWFFSYWKLRYQDKIWQIPPYHRTELVSKPDGSLKVLNKVHLSDPYDAKFWPNLFKFFKRHDIAFMLIYGEDDAVIDSRSLSSSSKILLETENHKNYETLFYPYAGHLIEHAYHPLADVVYDMRRYIYYGGEQPGHERAQEDSWHEILKFLQRNLPLEKQSKL